MDQLRVQLHKFETKDQCEKGGQLRDRQLNLARMQLNWYLKSKLLLRTSLNKSQIEDWVGCWHVFGTISFKWNGDVSSTVSKKKYPKGVVLNDIVGLLLPLDTRSRGRRRFPSPAFLFPLSLKQLKKMPTKPTHLLATWWKNRGDVPLGRLHSGRPGHPTPEPRLDRGSRAISSPVFLPINTRERESRRGSKRKEQNRRGKELKTKRKKKRITEEEKKKKNREADERRRRTATWSHRHFATSITANDSSHYKSASPSSSTSFFFFCVFFSTVHVVCEQWSGPLLSAQPKWLGLVRTN